MGKFRCIGELLPMVTWPFPITPICSKALVGNRLLLSLKVD